MVDIYSDDVCGCTINAASGTLTPMTGSPLGVGGEPESLAIDPQGRFLYVPNTLTDDVSAFTVDTSSGALTPVTGRRSEPARLPRALRSIQLASSST